MKAYKLSQEQENHVTSIIDALASEVGMSRLALAWYIVKHLCPHRRNRKPSDALLAHSLTVRLNVVTYRLFAKERRR